MTDEELAEIEARANAASTGPWRIEASEREGKVDGIHSNEPAPDWWQSDHMGPYKHVVVETDGGHYNPVLADAIFIAHARSDVPVLIAEIKRLRRYLDAVADVIRDLRMAQRE